MKNEIDEELDQEIEELELALKNQKEFSRHMFLTLGTVLVMAISFTVIFLTISLTKPTESDAQTLAVDESALSSLEALGTADVGSVVAVMNQKEYERESLIQESRSIEASIEASIAESIAYEENSIAQAEYESSVAEASREAEALLVNAPLEGSHIVAGTVNLELDDSDIPFIRRLYSNCIVIGNSRAKNAVDCGILTDNEVKFLSGTPVDDATPSVVNWAYLYKPKTLFIFGLNDVAHYDRDAQKFKADYTSMINQYLAVNPSSRIYVMESLPLPEEARSYFYRAMTSLPDFNVAMQEMCAENGWAYISASMYADFSLINSEDHAHYGKTFYFRWAQVIAEQMHLYEDLAGIPYEINWEPY